MGNTAAKNRQEQRERAARDLVEVKATMSSSITEFGVQLILLLHNGGGRLQLLEPQVSAPGYRLVREDTPFPVDLKAGGTQAIALRLEAPCRAGTLAAEPPADAQVLLPAVPLSARRQIVAVSFSAVPLSVLGKQACSFLTADGSAAPDFTDVHLEPYAVSFTLSLANHARQPLVLAGAAGPALAISVRGGFPIDIAALDDLIVPARVSIPRCADLPSALDPSRTPTSYAAFSLQLRFGTGAAAALPVLLDPGTPMFDELRALARKICPPGSFRSGPPGRRGSGPR